MLHLARAYGWKPAGTTLIDDETGEIWMEIWHEGYESMDGQWVSAEDASNLANALEKALWHFPRVENEKTLEYQIKSNTWTPPRDYQLKRAALLCSQ